MRLKIKIKETNYKRRPLTREEFITMSLADKGDIAAGVLIHKQGIQDGTYQLDNEVYEYGTAIFETTTFRDATRDEINTYHLWNLGTKYISDEGAQLIENPPVVYDDCILEVVE